jgi:hypothetical protein
MGNRPTRRAIQGLRAQIAEHLQKIADERANLNPDEDLIVHWENEVRAFAERLDRLEVRLSRKRQRGRKRK